MFNQLQDISGGVVLLAANDVIPVVLQDQALQAVLNRKAVCEFFVGQAKVLQRGLGVTVEKMTGKAVRVLFLSRR